MATIQVLNMPELLEHILLQDLSIKEVTCFRRCSKFACTVIDNSPKLRRFMFLEPLLERDHKICVDEFADGKPKFTATTIHPAIRNHWPDNCYLHINDTLKSWAPGQSWESMLICQPPGKVKQFKVEVYGLCGRYAPRWASVTFEGNTLGALSKATWTIGSQYKVVGVKFQELLMRELFG